jgi:hypothetical protein
MNYIRTYTGRKFFTTPTASQVDLDDIAVALSRAPRFGGHSYMQYSVAAHCIHVSHMVPAQLKLQALFHDASEAYIGDIPSPFKAIMPDYKQVERGIMDAVAKKFRFAWPIDPIVRQADSAALYQERRWLFRTPVGEDDLVIPQIKPPRSISWGFFEWSNLTSVELVDRFINRANELLK